MLRFLNSYNESNKMHAIVDKKNVQRKLLTYLFSPVMLSNMTIEYSERKCNFISHVYVLVLNTINKLTPLLPKHSISPINTISNKALRCSFKFEATIYKPINKLNQRMNIVKL